MIIVSKLPSNRFIFRKKIYFAFDSFSSLLFQVVKDGLTAEKASANCAELKRMQAGDVSFEEAKAAAASRARLEIDGVSAEKSQVHAKVKRQFSLKYLSTAMLGT